jgi:hypothetical protein
VLRKLTSLIYIYIYTNISKNCQPSAAQNFEKASTCLENFCTHIYIYNNGIKHAQLQTVVIEKRKMSSMSLANKQITLTEKLNGKQTATHFVST